MVTWHQEDFFLVNVRTAGEDNKTLQIPLYGGTTHRDSTEQHQGALAPIPQS